MQALGAAARAWLAVKAINNVRRLWRIQAVYGGHVQTHRCGQLHAEVFVDNGVGVVGRLAIRLEDVRGGSAWQRLKQLPITVNHHHFVLRACQ